MFWVLFVSKYSAPNKKCRTKVELQYFFMSETNEKCATKLEQYNFEVNVIFSFSFQGNETFRSSFSYSIFHHIKFWRFREVLHSHYKKFAKILQFCNLKISTIRLVFKTSRNLQNFI